MALYSSTFCLFAIIRPGIWVAELPAKIMRPKVGDPHRLTGIRSWVTSCADWEPCGGSLFKWPIRSTLLLCTPWECGSSGWGKREREGPAYLRAWHQSTERLEFQRVDLLAFSGEHTNFEFVLIIVESGLRPGIRALGCASGLPGLSRCMIIL